MFQGIFCFWWSVQICPNHATRDHHLQLLRFFIDASSCREEQLFPRGNSDIWMESWKIFLKFLQKQLRNNLNSNTGVFPHESWLKWFYFIRPCRWFWQCRVEIQLYFKVWRDFTKHNDFPVNQIAGYHVLAANGHGQCKRLEPLEKQDNENGLPEASHLIGMETNFAQPGWLHVRSNLTPGLTYMYDRLIAKKLFAGLLHNCLLHKTSGLLKNLLKPLLDITVYQQVNFWIGLFYILKDFFKSTLSSFWLLNSVLDVNLIFSNQVSRFGQALIWAFPNIMPYLYAYKSYIMLPVIFFYRSCTSDKGLLKNISFPHIFDITAIPTIWVMLMIHLKAKILNIFIH